MQQGVVPKICLAFEMRSDQKDPDQSTFKVIPDQDFAHFNFYVTHIFGEELVRTWLPLWGATIKADPEAVTDKLFDSLYGPSENVSNPSTSHTALLTPLDNDLPDEAPKGRKRRLLGRVRKQMGDLCLFGGSPVDAMNHYRAAAEISRAVGDWEWVGSTLESMASAILSVRDANGATKLGTLEVLEITNRLSEARTFYSRRLPKAPYLEAANLIRNSNFWLQQDKRLDMAECLSKCHDIVESLDSTQNLLKIRLLSSIALIYRNANFPRKYAYYIQLICRLCMVGDVPSARSHQLLEQIAPEYDINANSLLPEEKTMFPVNGLGGPGTPHPLSSTSTQDQTSSSPSSLPNARPMPKTRREKMIASGPSWTKLQASILTLLIDLSFASGDTLQSIKYLVYMMREVAPKFLSPLYSSEPTILSPESTDWGMRLRQLSNTLPPPLDTHAGDPLRLGLGIVQRWQPLKDPSVYMHISRSVNDPLFLYRPNRKAKEAIAASANHVFAWEGATIQFEFALRTAALQKTILEDVRIEFVPIVLVTSEPRPGDVRMEVDWLPPLEVDAPPQTSAQIVIDPKETVSVKISSCIPAVRSKKSDNTASTSSNPSVASSKFSDVDPNDPANGNNTNLALDDALQRIADDPKCKILLAPKSLNYTLYNCAFSEPLLPMFETAPKQLLLGCLHYIRSVPTVSIEDAAHPWISYTAATRDAEPIIAVNARPGKSRERNNKSENQQEGNQTSTATQQTNGAGKSIHNLTVATSQLRGEAFSTKLTLKNESKFVVNDFGMTIQENGETVTPNNPSKVIAVPLTSIYETISKALPLMPGEEIQIILKFVAPSLGLVQVSFLMEYRNNRSAENMWRKVRMDYSFKVVESLTPLFLEVSSGLESSLDVLDRAMPHNVMIVSSDSNTLEWRAPTPGLVVDSENYFLLQIALQNKTMLSFHVVKDDQANSTMNSNHNSFVVDPWATKRFCLAFHRNTFVKLMHAKSRTLLSNAGPKAKLTAREAYRNACKQFLGEQMQFSWRSYGNRSGSIHFDPASLITESVLDALIPQRVTTVIHLESSKGEILKLQSSAETSGADAFVVQANTIYKLCAEIKFNGFSADSIANEVIADANNLANEISPNANSEQTDQAENTPNKTSLFSALVRALHLNNKERNVTLIGKSQNIALSPVSRPGQSCTVHIPILFHSVGIYSIVTRVHDKDTEALEDYWTRDISVVVTR